jgi:predicted dehydrogenase
VGFARERFDDANAGDVLLDVGGQLADALLHLLERRPCEAAVAVCRVDDDRHR